MALRADIAQRLQQLNTDLNYALQDAYESEALTWHEALCATAVGDSSTVLFPFVADEVKVQQYVGGDRLYSEAQLGAFEVSFNRYSKGLKANRDAVRDDKTGLVMVANARNVGRKFAKLRPQLVANVLLDNVVCLDGQPLFSTAHPRNPVTKGGTPWSNDYTGMAFTPANVAKAMQLMEALPDPDGSPKNILARCILVPTALAYNAETVAHASNIPTLIGAPGAPTAAATTSNVLADPARYNLSVVTAPHLGALFKSDAGNAGSDTTWYMLDVRGAGPGTDDQAAALVMAINEALIMISQQSFADPTVWQREEFFWIGTERLVVAPGNPAKIARFNP